MGNLGIRVEDFVSYNAELSAMAATYGNTDVIDMKPDEAVKKLLETLAVEHSFGDMCHHQFHSDEPFCLCAYTLGLLLDVPGQLMLDAAGFKQAMLLMGERYPEALKVLAKQAEPCHVRRCRNCDGNPDPEFYDE